MSSADRTVTLRSICAADRRRLAARRFRVEVGEEAADEDRRPDPAEIGAGRPDAAEAQRRQVPFDHRAREVASADLVQASRPETSCTPGNA